MTDIDKKREEIEGILDCLWADGRANGCLYTSKDVMRDLADRGVVIKVDRELPGNIYKNHKMANALHVFHGTQQDMLCAGFASVEPLFDTKKGEG